MSITVRLIFWGLMGIVSDPKEERGMTALLVDPDLVQNINTRCPVPRHFSAVYLFEGQCVEGDCVRIPPGQEGNALRMGFRARDGRPVAEDGKYLGLAWLLDREDLDLSGDEDEKLKLRKPFLSRFRGKAPRTEAQASYFPWVQDMGKRAGGTEHLRLDCRRGENTCPLHARFTVQGGKVSACHVFHDPEPADSQDDERTVRVFEYTKPNGRKLHRAVADAVLVAYTEEGDSVTLSSQGLPRQGGLEAKATIKPDARGRLTLMVVNFPPDPSSHTDGCHEAHSDFLFHLLSPPPRPESRTRRDERNPKPRRAYPGACEPESLRLESLFKVVGGEPPHSTTACDNGYITW